ncbi:hypothetical protein IscW_ISCW009582 [Ixodes scapularis]|uniref:Uncharacterized protein n=1 Tax=Ixodes scapularis TaxID=6945 RepID=B7Q0M3_IXOSC|nr:hypothetical protein IscW_ISCW009582 [Ixodes scapularis]|eukprot:XP_002407982.1 hypothetical protein IscW_ISCW009582 [Ixodes scapularis]
MRKSVPSADGLAYAFACAECKSKPLSLLGGLMRRTASLDAIYLSAQWPRDLHSYCGRPMVDRATQCKSKPLSLLGGLMRRTASLDAIYLSAQWPRDLHSYCGRPMVDRATQTSDDWKEVDRIKYVQKKTTLASGDSLEMKASLSACEIERLVLKGISGAGTENEAELERLSKLGTSPRINKFLAREPPDGCEKVKIIDEGRKHTTVPMAGDASDSISKPNSQFVLRPSQRSAFCPLVRNPFQGVQRAPPGTDPFLLNERLQ